MDLEHLINKISRLLNEESGIIFHSDQTQNLVNTKGTILWNSSPTNISEDMYNEFKDSLKRSAARFYNMTNILPYADFCIALLCASGYSLNHNVTKSIQPRVFTGAWRSIHVLSKINEGEIAKWLTRHLAGRTAKGYKNAFNLDMDAGTIPLRSSGLGKSSKRYEIRDIIEDTSISAAMSNGVVDIKYYGDDKLPTPKMFYSTNTPEGQLSDLRIAHEMLTKDWKK